jgi:ATP-dependent Clp protease ATP-binding subunit ClpC
MAWSPDGAFLVTNGMDDLVRIWDARHITQAPDERISAGEVWVPENLPEREGNRLGTLRPLEDWGSSYTSVVIDADDHTLVAGYSDGHARRWNLDNGTVSWESHDKHEVHTVIDVVVSHDGSRIFSCGVDGLLRIRDVHGGLNLRQVRLEGHLQMSIAPDDRQILIHDYTYNHPSRLVDAESGEIRITLPQDNQSHYPSDWSPDGVYIALGGTDDVHIFDPQSGIERYRWGYTGRVWAIRWSPNGREMLLGYRQGNVLVIDPFTGTVRLRLSGLGGISALDWSPDGGFFATGNRETGQLLLRLWDAQTGVEVERFSLKQACFRLRWSTNGAFIVSGHDDSIIHVWDVRHLGVAAPEMASQPDPVLLKTPLPADLQFLPAALAHLSQMDIHPPLALVRDLLALTGGQTVSESLAQLAQQLPDGLAALIDLRWPAPARIGLVALLLHDLPLSGWQPPAASAAQLRSALHIALLGAPVPPDVPDFPFQPLQQAVNQIDDRIITLLTLLGPDAVAADPALPLRLLPQLPNLPPLSLTQRQLLGLRLASDASLGQSTAARPTAVRSSLGGIQSGSARPDWNALLPSQFALPESVFTARFLRGELLFRAHDVAEPPRLRPLVLILDVSPATCGPVQAITRLAAHILAQSWQQAAMPLLLLTLDLTGETILPILHPADILQVWTARSLRALNVPRTLRLAASFRATLASSADLSPIILLLTHPWCGADDPLPSIPALRALFVQYPGFPTAPALAPACERWQSLLPQQSQVLPDTLAFLIS